MQDRPSQDELLAAIEGFLRRDVLPGAEGRVRYHLRVAVNLLGILRRELALEPQALQREWEGLRALGIAGPRAGANASDLRAVNERLNAAIREGAYDVGAERTALLHHLRAVVRDKLRVANPDFLRRVEEEPLPEATAPPR